MPYPDAYNDAAPGDTDLLEFGPSVIRALARAIEQRLNTLCNFTASTDPTTDPVVLNAAVIKTAMIAAQQITNSLMATASVDTAQLTANLKNQLFAVVAQSWSSNVGLVNAGTQSSEVIPVANAKLNLPAWVAFSVTGAVNDLITHAFVSAAGQVTVTYYNPTASAITVDGTTPRIVSALAALT